MSEPMHQAPVPAASRVDAICERVLGAEATLWPALALEVQMLSLEAGYPFGLVRLVRAGRLEGRWPQLRLPHRRPSYREGLDALARMAAAMFGHGVLTEGHDHAPPLLPVADQLLVQGRMRAALLVYSLSALACEGDDDVFVWSEIGVARCLHNGYRRIDEFTSPVRSMHPSLFDDHV